MRWISFSDLKSLYISTQDLKQKIPRCVERMIQSTRISQIVFEDTAITDRELPEKKYKVVFSPESVFCMFR